MIKLVQVSCPSSCPSLSFRPWPQRESGPPGIVKLRELVTRQPAVVQFLVQVPGRTWTSSFVREKHVTKFVQVPPLSQWPTTPAPCACLALCLLGTSTVPAWHRACSARLLKCLLGTVPARHCACSARLLKCLLGTVPARHIYLGARSAPPCLAKFSRMSDLRQPDRKKQGGHFHGVEPHAHAKPCEKRASCVTQKTSCSTCHAKKTSCSTCHAKTMQNRAKNKLFHMSCNNHAKTMQNAARTECQPAEPSQSPGSLLYVLYVLYGSHKASH